MTKKFIKWEGSTPTSAIALDHILYFNKDDYDEDTNSSNNSETTALLEKNPFWIKFDFVGHDLNFISWEFTTIEERDKAYQWLLDSHTITNFNS